MAKVERKRVAKYRKKTNENRLPFTSTNYKIFGIGIIVLILGYISLSQRPVDSFMSLTVAPILLVIGYLVIIPLSFLYQKKTRKPDSQPHEN